MPRVELIPPGWANSTEKARGDGAPTTDVCSNCIDCFETGEPLDLENFDNEFAKRFVATPVVGCTEVAHPDFKGEKYRCAACGAELGPEDN